MFGTYQHSNLRIEIDASAHQIEESLTSPSQLRNWLWPQQLDLPSNGSTTTLVAGQAFSSTLGVDLGLAKVNHQVEVRSPHGIRFLLSGSIDGFHEWQWGEGWVQSRLEGISLLPLNLGQTLSLMKLKQYLSSQSPKTNAQ